jgi:hypothetical protein
MADAHDRRADWTPAKRPEWLATFNDLGRHLDVRSIVPLDEASLLGQAMRNTGLDDFGGDNWRPHFRALIRFIEEEARLHFFGRVLTRSDFVLFLEARLRIVDAFKKHPEINEESVEEPVFILGLGRSGTTILHDVLSRDPQFRSVKKWEALFPWPAPEPETYETDPRIGQAQGIADVLAAVTPEWRAMHASEGDQPVEDTEFTYPAFMSEVWTWVYKIPSWEAYFAEQDLAHHFGWHEKTLKFLQWRHRKPHWLLKNPTHMPRIPQLLQHYPDARFIFTHRDPIPSADSLTSLMGTVYYQRTDHPYGSGTSDDFAFADPRARLWDDVIDWMENGTLREGSYANLHYRDFMQAPMAAIEGAYREIGLAVTTEAFERMDAYLRSKPQGAHGKHDYQRADASIIAEERRKYRRYQEYFNVPNEI